MRPDRLILALIDPLAQVQILNDMTRFYRIMATGYGRHLFQLSFDAPTVTEISAFAVGAHALFPGVQTILDIGGQDAKAIAVSKEGKVTKFEMNDRCGAGTKKFSEIMPKIFGIGLMNSVRRPLRHTKISTLKCARSLPSPR